MASIARVLFNTPVNGNLRPIYLRIIKNRKPYYLQIYKNDKRFRAKAEQWDSNNKFLVKNKKLNPEYKLLNDIITKRENKLREILEGYTNDGIAWSINMVRQQFYNLHDDSDVCSFIEQMTEQATKNKKQSDVNALKALNKDLCEFNNLKTIAFPEVDYDFVEEFIRYNQYLNRNKTTIGIKLRYLRKVLNEAIRNKIGSKATYPFSDKYGANKVIKVSQFEKEERKLAIDDSIIDKFLNTSFDDINYEITRRLFIASYAGRGMNYRDQAFLSQKNIIEINGNKHVQIARHKTSNPIIFKISNLLQEQIDWFSANTELKDDYIFPIIPNDKNVETDFKFMHSSLNRYNYYLRQIAKKLDIDLKKIKISSYVARHTFATKLYHNNVNINVISQALAHKNTNSTKNYLKKFEPEAIDTQIESIIG